jgi:competence protein ComEC
VLPRLSRPALGPSIALLCGVAVADGGGGVALMWTLSAILLALVAWHARRRVVASVTALFCTVAFVGGIWLGVVDQRERECRAAELFGDADAVEAHFRGIVRNAAQRDSEGDRWLLLRGRPESAEQAGDPYRVLLRIAPSVPAADDRVDRLRAGDAVRIWCRLRAPRPAGNPGTGGSESWLRAVGLDATGRVKSTRLVDPVELGGPGGRRWADVLRRWARRRLARSVPGPPDVSALLRAVLLGDRGALSSERIRELRKSGLVHLVAISGLHVGLISLALLGSLRRAGVSSWAVLCIMSVLLLFFALVVGPRPSVSRAVSTALGFALARCLGRTGDGLNTLGLLAACLVILEPGALWNPGLQLSFVATGGIIAWSRAIQRRLPLPPILGLPLGVTASAYVATLPLVAWHFGWLAPVGLLVNVPALPLCAVALACGYASILLVGVPGVGELCARGCELAAGGILKLAALAAGIDGGNFAAARPAPLIVGLFYGMVLLLGALPRPTAIADASTAWRTTLRRGAVAVMVAAAWIVHLGPAPPRSGVLEAWVIDVGQGQAVALRGSRGGWVLVDAGGSSDPRFDPGERVVLPLLRRQGARRIQALVASHGDTDHVAGAFAVLRGLEVGELWLAPGWHRNGRLLRLSAVASRRGVALRLVERGTRVASAGIPIEVLWPGREQLRLGGNDRSIVIRAGTAPSRILIPGDLESDGERHLRLSEVALSAEALIVAHHGSRTGTCASFLRDVAPQEAVVSCGRGNRFGHPHREVLDRLDRLGITLWRTDRHGLVRLRAQRDGWSADVFHTDADNRGP